MAKQTKLVASHVDVKDSGKSRASKSKRKPRVAFLKPLQPDAILGVIVGPNPLPRTELTKRLWDYIKNNGLQDAKRKTRINTDNALKAVFNGKKSVSMQEMTKLVTSRVT